MEAQISIMKNEIFKNINQGILLTEKSSAHIEINQIYENIKANIAFGGDLSCNTVITNNKIFKGRCEGIFCVEGGFGIIHGNDIIENHDGIICCTSVPLIERNNITQNKKSGIIVIKDGRPKVYYNTIKKNGEVGLFIRDKSIGVYQNNVIRNNRIELIVERKTPELAKVHKENKIQGEIRSGEVYSCSIM